MIDRVSRAGAHHRLGMVGDADVGRFQHRQIVRPVAYRDREAAVRGKRSAQTAEGRGFRFGIDDRPDQAAGKLLVDDLQRVRARVLDSETKLQPLGEEREDGARVARRSPPRWSPR